MCNCNYSQNSMVWKDIAPRVESTAIVVLNGHTVQQASHFYVHTGRPGLFGSQSLPEHLCLTVGCSPRRNAHLFKGLRMRD